MKNLLTHLAMILAGIILMLVVLKDELNINHQITYYNGSLYVIGKEEQKIFRNRTAGAESLEFERISPDQIYVGGYIKKGDCVALKSAIKENDVIFLNSLGGNVDESLCMTKYLKDMNVDTVIEDPFICVSACVWLFLAGDDRTLIRDALVSIHSPGYPSMMYYTVNGKILVHEALKTSYKLIRALEYLEVSDQLIQRLVYGVPNWTFHQFDYRDFDDDIKNFNYPELKEIANHYVDFYGYNSNKKKLLFTLPF